MLTHLSFPLSLVPCAVYPVLDWPIRHLSQIKKSPFYNHHEDSVGCPGFHLVRRRIGASANEGCQDHSDCQGAKGRWHGRHGTGCCHDDDVMGYSKGSRARKYLFPRDRGISVNKCSIKCER
jgi:hypothetical protein